MLNTPGKVYVGTLWVLVVPNSSTASGFNLAVINAAAVPPVVTQAYFYQSVNNAKSTLTVTPSTFSGVIGVSGGTTPNGSVPSIVPASAGTILSFGANPNGPGLLFNAVVRQGGSFFIDMSNPANPSGPPLAHLKVAIQAKWKVQFTESNIGFVIGSRKVGITCIASGSPANMMVAGSVDGIAVPFQVLPGTPATLNSFSPIEEKRIKAGGSGLTMGYLEVSSDSSLSAGAVSCSVHVVDANNSQLHGQYPLL